MSGRTEGAIEIWLARHGATEWSRSGQHTGSTDLPLLLEGEAEAGELGRRIGAHPFVHVLCSPMARARETARLAGFGDWLEVTDLLREYDYGEYEGLTTKEIQQTRAGWELFRDGCPGGESPEEMAARMDRLVGFIDRTHGDVLVFGHGHCLRALTARYLGLQIWVAGLLRLDPASLSILGSEHDHPALRRWNDTGRTD